jgi:hypothetical protein
MPGFAWEDRDKREHPWVLYCYDCISTADGTYGIDYGDRLVRVKAFLQG